MPHVKSSLLAARTHRMLHGMTANESGGPSFNERGKAGAVLSHQLRALDLSYRALVNFVASIAYGFGSRFSYKFASQSTLETQWQHTVEFLSREISATTMAILTFIPYELPGSRPKTVLNDDFRDINDFNKPCGEKPAKPISQRVDQSTKQRCDEPSVWKDPFRGRPELRKWLASDCVDFDERKNGNSSRAHDGNGSQGERNLSRPERTCITAIGNPLLIEDTGCDGLSRHRVEERHGLLDGSVEDTLSNETRRIDQQTLQPFNGVSKLDKNFQGVTCDENESESRYEESKADTAQIHATEDGIESDDTNVCDELGTFAIIHDRYGSIKHKTSSSSSQGQGESDHVLGRIYLTIAGDAVTLNIHDGYNSDSNSKGRCRSNVHGKYDLQ